MGSRGQYAEVGIFAVDPEILLQPRRNDHPLIQPEVVDHHEKYRFLTAFLDDRYHLVTKQGMRHHRGIVLSLEPRQVIFHHKFGKLLVGLYAL